MVYMQMYMLRFHWHFQQEDNCFPKVCKSCWNWTSLSEELSATNSRSSHFKWTAKSCSQPVHFHCARSLNDTPEHILRITYQNYCNNKLKVTFVLPFGDRGLAEWTIPFVLWLLAALFKNLPDALTVLKQQRAGVWIGFLTGRHQGMTSEQI